MTSQATLTKQVNALMTKYVSDYKAKHKREPQFNRYRQKWGFQDMLADIGYEKSQEVIDYFFSLRRPEHGVQALLNNYDRYAKVLEDLARDREERHRLREETAQRVREWEESGNGRGGSS